MASASADATMTFTIHDHDTSQEALSAYATFHAATLHSPTAKRLVFVPNQYGLGNRLRALKASLLVAMLTGRVFHVRWDEPYKISEFIQHNQVDWRLETLAFTLPVVDPDGAPPEASAEADILCLPFATAPRAGRCQEGLRSLQRGNLSSLRPRVLEVHTFTDLHIYLHTNPHYASTLARLGRTCPKRMGCLYDFLLAPQPLVREQLALALSAAAAAPADHVGVQVRNRLWIAERYKSPSPAGIPSPAGERILHCMERYVPPGATIFFTADDDSLYPLAAKRWGARLRTTDGGVYLPWSRGGKVDAASLGDAERRAVLKAIVDWFALRSATRIVYTYQSSFGKTAAEASSAPNLDVNHSRCVLADARWGAAVGAAAAPDALDTEWAENGDGVAYDASTVPGSKASKVEL